MTSIWQNPEDVRRVICSQEQNSAHVMWSKLLDRFAREVDSEISTLTRQRIWIMLDRPRGGRDFREAASVAIRSDFRQWGN